MNQLGDLLFGSIGGIWKLLPEHLRKDAQARLQDHNPFARTTANEDLLRGLRLAWIDVALKIDKAVLALPSSRQPGSESAAIQRFSALVRSTLVAVRSDTFDRDTTLRDSPIDKHLQSVLTGVPKYVIDRTDDRGDDIGWAFGDTLAAVVGWPAAEVPELYRQVALVGLLDEGGQTSRAFGELVFATFSHFVKHPSDHPETAAAFQIAQVEIARSVALQTLGVARGLDAKFDALLARLEATPYKSLDDFVAQAQLVASGVAQLSVKVDALPTRDQLAEMIEQTLSTSLKRELAEVARGMGGWLAGTPRELLPVDLLRQVVELYGHPDVPAHELVPTLRRYALAYRDLMRGVAGRHANHRYDTDTRDNLARLIAEGDLAAAETLIAHTLTRQQAIEQDLGRQRAATLSDRARLAFLRDDLAGVCVFLRDARHAVRSDRRLVWAYALQTYALLCRDKRVTEAVEWSPDLAGSDIDEHWESFSDPADVGDAIWANRDRIAAAIDGHAQMVIADAEEFQRFRVWSSRIETTANLLFDLAKQSRNLLEARAALAGFGLFSDSFYSSDDPIDIENNRLQIHDARALVETLGRAQR